jgi:hypothetical protein
VHELLQRQAALRIPLPASADLIAALERLDEEYERSLRARFRGARRGERCLSHHDVCGMWQPVFGRIAPIEQF